MEVENCFSTGNIFYELLFYIGLLSILVPININHNLMALK